MEKEHQQELGMEGLLDDDCYLAECNLGDLEVTSGIRETYWLLAIQAAWEAEADWREYRLSQSQQSRTVFREGVFRNNSYMAA
jgi:hypothetical protein